MVRGICIFCFIVSIATAAIVHRVFRAVTCYVLQIMI